MVGLSEREASQEWLKWSMRLKRQLMFLCLTPNLLFYEVSTCLTQPGGWGHDDAAMLPREAAVIQPEGYDDSSAPVRVIYYHSTRVFDVVIAAAAVRPSERTVVFNINT